MNGGVGRRLISLLLVLAFLAGMYWLFINRQEVFDWWRLLSYKPSADVVALADSSTMHDRGRNLFYVSDPQIDNKDKFNSECTDTGEQSLVLGCYSLQSIFIYNVTDPRLKGVKEVTAAHEMLHAAYERLGSGEKDRVNKLLQTQLTKISDARLNELIDLYNKEEPGELLNEMHSILGTEFGNLSPELEQYYKQYFSDRSKLVGFANDYAAIFTQSQNQIATYDHELEELKKQIDTNTGELNNRRNALSSQGAQLDAMRTSDPAAYNSAVPSYNANVRAYNDLVSRTRTLINQYNDLVVARNNEVAAQNDLYHSLDSNYQPVSTD